MKWHGHIACVVFVLLIGSACDAQDLQTAFVEDAGRLPAGITRTSENGQVIEADGDDWRESPVYIGDLRVDPAYPNPSAGGFVTIPVTIVQFNAVRGRMVLRAYNHRGELVLLDELVDTAPGTYSFNFAASLLPGDGLHRVFIFDGVGELISYGDIELQ